MVVNRISSIIRYARAFPSACVCARLCACGNCANNAREESATNQAEPFSSLSMIVITIRNTEPSVCT